MRTDVTRTIVVALLLAVASLGVGTGCGGGGGGGTLYVPQPAAPTVTVDEGVTDALGETTIDVDGVLRYVRVEDAATGLLLEGVRVGAASNGETGGVLVIDETGAYPAVFAPLPVDRASVSGSLSTSTQSRDTAFDLATVIKLAATARDVAVLVADLSDIEGDILDALLQWAGEWATDHGLLQWGERVRLSELESSLAKNYEEIWSEWGDNVGTSLITSVRKGEGLDKKALWKETLILYNRELIEIGQDIIYWGYRKQCYPPDAMMTIYRVGPITLNVVPDGPPPITASGEVFSLSGTVRDRETGIPLPGVRVTLLPSAEVVISDADGAYAFSDVKIGCTSLTNWYLVASKPGYVEDAFWSDEMALVGDAANTFDFDLAPPALPPEVNVALADNGGEATGSSIGSYLGQVQYPSYGIDDDGLTSWSNSGHYPTSSDPAWFVVEFDASYTIHAVGVLWSSHQHDYSISLSTDGTSWTTVVPSRLGNSVEGQLPDAAEYFEITPRSARYIRVDITSTSAPGSHIFQASVAELQAFTR